MCNAYNVGKREGGFPSFVEIAKAVELLEPEVPRLIRRTDMAPVYSAGEGLREMRWGFERNGLGVINNSRADKLNSPMWREAFEERRCVIPVAWFYEWSGPKGRKRTHRFSHPEGEWLWMAGIWEEMVGKGECFSMVTTVPNAVVAPYHTRMPAILESDELEPYLDGKVDRFSPRAETLVVSDAPNPLLKTKPAATQGELF